MPIGSFTSNRNINATTPHATPITVCQRPPRRRPLHPGPAVVACRKSLARKESRRGLSHPRSSPHTQRIAESKRAAPIAEHHRSRPAYVYLRQSTPYQVRHHQESTERQYALRGKALELGWNESLIHTLDRDLGKTGTEMAAREDFKTLVAEVSMGQ